MKDYQWLAEVRVKVGDNKYSLSTGVPLSRRYILTTGHGVPQPDDKERQVEVRFVADCHNRRPWRPAKTVWHGGYGLDAALLEIAEVADLQAAIYAAALPETTASWEGAGFPAASKITEGELAGERDTTGLCGKYLPGGNLKSQELDLTVEGSPRIPGKWAGISGAPVFCESKLIGIVKSYPENFAGDKLSAVPMWRLLENADLRKLLGFDEREKLLAQKQRRIVALLEDSKEVLAALHAQPDLQDKLMQPKVVALALLDMDVGKFLDTVHRASLEKEVGQGKARQVMEDLLGELLPFLYDPGVVESLRLNLSFGMLYLLPAATETIAEIIMAGMDRRPALFRKPVPGEEHPVGAATVEPPPECGFSIYDPNTPSAFDEHMIKKYAPADRDKESDLEKLREIVNDELEFIAEKKFPYRYRHYFFCQQPVNDEQRQTLMVLQKHYPQLVFIILAGDSLRSERKLCRPLREFFAPMFGEDAA